MEKDQGSPPEVSAPPYPGPPLDYNVGFNQAQPGVQPGIHFGVYPGVQPGIQSGVQPGIQSGVYPGVQPDVQPGPVVVQQPLYWYSPQQPLIAQSVNQVMVVQQPPTDAPGHMTCPVCRNIVLTRTEYRNGVLTWLLCVMLLVICWPGCWIPFCIKSCKDVVHYCPSCNNVIHIHKRR